ncbi:MAG: hypothetical protein WAO36_07175 [Candidatus Methanoculleus thermohydrogenotrophicum]|nr:hypothetical protein [Candidatus Methanoculleus thermohydrogenotrophicum]
MPKKELWGTSTRYSRLNSLGSVPPLTPTPEHPHNHRPPPLQRPEPALKILVAPLHPLQGFTLPRSSIATLYPDEAEARRRPETCSTTDTSAKSAAAGIPT